MADLFEWMESEYQPKKHIINIYRLYIDLHFRKWNKYWSSSKT